MKLICKKIVYIALSASILFSFASLNLCTSANAKESIENNSDNDIITISDIAYAQENLFPALERNLVCSPDALGFSVSDVQSLSIGDSFTIANYENGEFKEVNDILYFPIITDSDILALLTLTKYNGELSATIGRDFSDELSSYIDECDEQIALFAYNRDIIGINKYSDIDIIYDYPSLDTTKNNFFESIEYNEVANSTNVISSTDIYEITSVINIASLEPTRYYNYNYLSNYPIVYQAPYDICWAATAAAMVIYEVNSINSLTATQVCDALGHMYSFGSTNDLLNALNYYLPSIYAPTYFSYPMSQYDIKVIINNDDPAAMLCHDVNGIAPGHIVSLCGYGEWENGFEIRYMNSAYNCINFCTASSNGFIFPSGNINYRWDYTVRLLYNI